MAEEIKEYLDLEGLSEYNKKRNELFQDLTIEEVEEAFNELDESDPSYSAFYDIITKAKEATKAANDNAEAASQATENAKTATGEAELATQAANKAADDAQKLIDSVNDMTTGINLLRGTREFREGKNRYTSSGIIVYYDGFAPMVSNTKITHSPNEPSVLSFNPGGTVISIPSSATTNVSAGEQLTISLKLRFDAEITDASDTYVVLYMLDEKATQLKSIYYDLAKLSITNVSVGKWYQAIIHYAVPDEFTSGNCICVNLRSKNTEVSFTELCMCKGYINHPIYAPSPNDIDYINDITTGINLLRETRKLKTWTTNSTSANKPGNVLSGGATVKMGDDGFTYVQTSSTAEFSGVFNVVPAYGLIKKGDIITFSWEAEFDSELSGNCCFIAICQGVNRVQSIDINLKNNTSTNLKAEPPIDGSFKPGVKYKLAYTFVVTVDILEDYILQFKPQASNVSARFKKYCAYKGDINNPEWSASPLDIDDINDITTGVNLLRGTRDIDLGSFNVKGVVYTDGFRMDSSGNIWSIEKLPNGFSCIKAHRTTTSSGNSYCRSSYFTNTGETIFTLSGELEVSVFYRDSATFARIVGLTESGTEVGNVSATFSQIGFDGTILNTPYKFKYTYDVSSISSAKYFYVDFQFPSASIATYKFYKLALYPGDINNPEWSPSPFDYSSSTVEIYKPYLMGNIVKDHILEGGSLNDIKEPGVYGISSAYANSIQNMPTNSAGRLYVEYSNNGSGNYIRQRFVTASGSINCFVRTYEDQKGWLDWEKTSDLMSASRIADFIWQYIASKIESTYNVTKK